jgi:NAD(P)-dependent dehydrogenase (short-subunit alcohol dehydrogenase family)
MGKAVVIGGTGMLAGTVQALVEEGREVVLASRRRRLPPAQACAGGSVHWGAGDWSRPGELAQGLASAGAQEADLLVAWVHSPHREPVLQAVAPLLAPGAGVVEVWASAAADPLASLPAPVLPAHRTHQAVLGYARSGGRTRWLTHAEIGAGVLAAARAADAGRPGEIHEVGELRPWPPR